MATVMNSNVLCMCHKYLRKKLTIQIYIYIYLRKNTILSLPVGLAVRKSMSAKPMGPTSMINIIDSMNGQNCNFRYIIAKYYRILKLEI